MFKVWFVMRGRLRDLGGMYKLNMFSSMFFILILINCIFVSLSLLMSVWIYVVVLVKDMLWCIMRTRPCSFGLMSMRSVV